MSLSWCCAVSCFFDVTNPSNPQNQKTEGWPFGSQKTSNRSFNFLKMTMTLPNSKNRRLLSIVNVMKDRKISDCWTRMLGAHVGQEPKAAQVVLHKTTTLAHMIQDMQRCQRYPSDICICFRESSIPIALYSFGWLGNVMPSYAIQIDCGTCRSIYEIVHHNISRDFSSVVRRRTIWMIKLFQAFEHSASFNLLWSRINQRGEAQPKANWISVFIAFMKSYAESDWLFRSDLKNIRSCEAQICQQMATELFTCYNEKGYQHLAWPHLIMIHVIFILSSQTLLYQRFRISLDVCHPKRLNKSNPCSWRLPMEVHGMCLRFQNISHMISKICGPFRNICLSVFLQVVLIHVSRWVSLVFQDMLFFDMLASFHDPFVFARRIRNIPVHMPETRRDNEIRYHITVQFANFHGRWVKGWNGQCDADGTHVNSMIFKQHDRWYVNYRFVALKVVIDSWCLCKCSVNVFSVIWCMSKPCIAVVFNSLKVLACLLILWPATIEQPQKRKLQGQTNLSILVRGRYTYYMRGVRATIPSWLLVPTDCTFLVIM